MRALLEIYRWVTLAMFIVSGLVLLIPVIVWFLPGYHVEIASGFGYLGMIMVAVTFGVSGFNVIMIAIYDQLRAATAEVEYTRAEIAGLREDMRDHGR